MCKFCYARAIRYSATLAFVYGVLALIVKG